MTIQIIIHCMFYCGKTPNLPNIALPFVRPTHIPTSLQNETKEPERCGEHNNTLDLLPFINVQSSFLCLLFITPPSLHPFSLQLFTFPYTYLRPHCLLLAPLSIRLCHGREEAAVMSLAFPTLCDCVFSPIASRTIPIEMHCVTSLLLFVRSPACARWC